MSYDEWTMQCLTPEEQMAIVRQLSHTWKPIDESVNEIVARLDRRLDIDWISEYLAWNDKHE
jgi:hypothetical protein